MLSDTGKGCFKQASSPLGLHFRVKGPLRSEHKKETQSLGERVACIVKQAGGFVGGTKKKSWKEIWSFFPFTVPTRHKDVTSRRKEDDFDFETCSF